MESTNTSTTLSTNPNYYLLETEEWVKMTLALNCSELKVFYYLKISGLSNFNIDSLSQDLSLGKSTVYRTINSLEKKGLIVINKQIEISIIE